MRSIGHSIAGQQTETAMDYYRNINGLFLAVLETILYYSSLKMVE